MAAASETIQMISRLTPLSDVTAMVDLRVKAVTPRTLDVAAASGRALAVDAMAPPRPTAALSLIDGWALAADATLGAVRAFLGLRPAATPTSRLVHVGAEMPGGLADEDAAFLRQVYATDQARLAALAGVSYEP